MSEKYHFSADNNFRRAFAEIALLLLFIGIVYAADLLLLSAVTKGEFWVQFTSGTKTQSMTVAYAVVLYFSLLTAVIVFWNKTSSISPIKAFFSAMTVRSAGKGILYGFLLFCLFFLLAAPFSSFSKITQPPQEIMLHAFINIISCFFLALSEEFIFRGVIFGICAKHLKKAEAIIIVSVLFGLAHLFCPGTLIYKSIYFVNLFLFSVILCMGTTVFKNILFSACLHFILIYLILLRNYMGIMTVKPECVGAFVCMDASPMTGLMASLILLCAIYFFKKLLIQGKI